MAKVPRTPQDYIERLDEPRRTEIRELHELILKTVPNLKPGIEGGMLAYGPFHYRYPTGREGDWVVVGLASRKQGISLYVNAEKDGRYLPETYAERLPKADIGKSCIRIKRAADLDPATLKRLLREAEKRGGAAAAEA